MVFIRIIKGSFYKYENYRNEEGKVKTRYLGKATEQDYLDTQKRIAIKQRKKKSIMKRIFG